MNTLFKKLSKRMAFILFLLLLLTIVVINNESDYNVVANINRTKSLPLYHLVKKYDNLDTNLSVVNVESLEDIKKFGPLSPISYKGTMTGYGPDCVGCGGKTGCAPYQDVRDGNIHFNDQTYGKVRIIAVDRGIPCGSIFKITGLTFEKNTMTAIALDRGGAIKGKLSDLLFESEEVAKMVGRQQNVNYEVIRWGW